MDTKMLILLLSFSGLITGCQKNRVSDPVGLNDFAEHDTDTNNVVTDNNWKKIAEININNQDRRDVRISDFPNGNNYKIYKVFFQGNISASGTGSATDRRILIVLNSSSSGYYSVASAITSSDGHPFTENDDRGFYVGRNGWRKDMNISFEYTISVMVEKAATTGFGQATFSNSSGDLLGYRSYGNFGGMANIYLVGIRVIPEAIGVEGTPGNLTGKLTIYAQ